MDKINLIVNQLPAPTWNRLRMNDSHVQLAVPTDECEPKVALQGSVCLNKQQIPRSVTAAVLLPASATK